MTKAPQRTEQREPQFKIYRDSGDKFHVDPEMIPDGMSYEWKRLSTFGQEDRRHQVNLARNRWTPVPADRHPEIGGDPTLPDKDGRMHPHAGCIIMDGLILMERPAQITKIVQEDDTRRAKDQVGQQFQRLKLVPDGTMGNEKGERHVTVRRERDLSIPEDADV